MPSRHISTGLAETRAPIYVPLQKQILVGRKSFYRALPVKLARKVGPEAGWVLDGASV
jgi:hypothetical protein